MATVNGSALLVGAGGEAADSFPALIVSAVPTLSASGVGKSSSFPANVVNSIILNSGGVIAGNGTASILPGTITLPVTNTAYSSLGTGPMWISPDSGVQIVIGSMQPTASTIGHPLGYAYAGPFYFQLSEQVWALSSEPNGSNVVITT